MSPSFAADRLDQLGDRDRVLANERLLKQADLFVELAHAAFHNFVEHLLRLAFGAGAVFLDFAFLSRTSADTSSLLTNCGLAAATCMARSCTSFLNSSLEAVSALAGVHFQQNTDLASGVDVVPDTAASAHFDRSRSGRC